MKLFIVYMHYNNPPMILFGKTRAEVGRTIKAMLGPDMVNEVVPISNQDAEAQFGPDYEIRARMNMLRSEKVSVLSGDNPFLREKMDIKKADMGDVIDDFKKSDAPQFQGKSMAKRRQMAIAAKLNSEGAMKRIATQDDERERLGPRKVKGDGMDTFKKKYPDHLSLKKARAAFAPTKGGADVKKEDIKLSEAVVDQKLIKTLKAMMKDGESDSVRLLIQGLPRNMKKDVMKKIGMKETVDGRTKAFKETIQRLNMSKQVPVNVSEEEDWHKNYPVTYTKGHSPDGKTLHLKVRHVSHELPEKPYHKNPGPSVKHQIKQLPKHKELKDRGYTISHYGSHDNHDRHENIHGNKPDVKKESVDEKTIEELSKKTMGSYINKAVKSKGNAYTRDGVGAGKAIASDTYQDDSVTANDNPKPGYDKPARGRKIRNRSQGIKRAADKMSAESKQVDELSKKTLGNYIKKASDDHGYKSHSRGLNHTDPEGHDDDPTTLPTSNRPTDVFSKRRKAATGSAHTVATKQAALKKDISNREKGIATAVKKMSEKTADEQEADGGGHIVMQLRKSVSMRGQKDVKFNDGSTHKVSAAHAQKFLSKHGSLKTSHEKRALQNKAAKSHDHFQNSISEEDLEERTPIRPTIQDKKQKNLRIPNPNYKGRLERPKKKKRDMFKEFINKDEVGIDKPEEVSEYTSFDWYSDYIKLTNKK